MDRSYIKYIFVIVVLILVVYTGYKLIKDDSEGKSETLDQTSKVSTIQKDIRLAIAELDTINPILSHNRNVQEISRIIFEPLVTLNANYKLENCLATEVVKQDDLTYIVKIRKGVFWSNGNNFTSEDVQFTIDRIKDENSTSIYRDNLRYVTRVSRPDEYTVIIELSETVPFFEYNLTFPILSKEYYDGEDFYATEKNVSPVGTGLFKIEVVDTNLIKLVKNDIYWNTSKTPMAQEININLYGSMGEVYNAFKSGELDIVTVKANNVEDYIGTLGYNKVEYRSRQYDFLAFNTLSGVFTDSNVRKAISLVLDKNAIVATCLGNGYVPSNFSLDMGEWLYVEDLNVATNVDEAKNILIQNGWVYKYNSWMKDGNRINLSITVNSNNEARVRVAEAIAEQLNSFGIKTTVQQFSAERYRDALNGKNFECIFAGIENSFSPSLHTFFGEGNLANYTNEEMFDLIKKTENTIDEGEMFNCYRTIFSKYLEEVPYIGLYRNTDIVVYNQGLVGNISPNAYNLYFNIEKWYRQ